MAMFVSPTDADQWFAGIINNLCNIPIPKNVHFVCRHSLLRLSWDGSCCFKRDGLGWEVKIRPKNPLDAALRK